MTDALSTTFYYVPHTQVRPHAAHNINMVLELVVVVTAAATVPVTHAVATAHCRGRRCAHTSVFSHSLPGSSLGRIAPAAFPSPLLRSPGATATTQQQRRGQMNPILGPTPRTDGAAYPGRLSLVHSRGNLHTAFARRSSSRDEKHCAKEGKKDVRENEVPNVGSPAAS
jgi:hypothetical protein